MPSEHVHLNGSLSQRLGGVLGIPVTNLVYRRCMRQEGLVGSVGQSGSIIPVHYLNTTLYVLGHANKWRQIKICSVSEGAIFLLYMQHTYWILACSTL